MITKQMKLVTLSLLLKSMPVEHKNLLLSYFSPETARVLQRMEAEMEGDPAQLDWTPIYESFPELKNIVEDCRKEIRLQKIADLADEQRPSIKQYILMKIGKQRKGGPVFLSEGVKNSIDKYLNTVSN